MTKPSSAESAPRRPSGPSLAFDRVLTFARALSGTLRPHSVVERLLQEVKATFGPSAAAVLLVDEQGHPESANGDTEHSDLGPLLRQALREAGPTASVTPSGHGVAWPLTGRRSVLGASGVLLNREPTTTDLKTLEGLVVVAAVALEGTLLVHAADQRHQIWEDAADAVSLAICIVERSGRIEGGNRAFVELAGSPAGGVAGHRWQELLPPGWHGGISAALGGAVSQEIDLPGRTIAVTAFDAAGLGGRMVLLFEDQTDRRRLQDRLIQSEKLTAIGQLIAGVAHDLNNPLTSVVGFADFLAESSDAPPRMREPLRVIQQEAERASKIVKNLLSFARRQESRQPAGLRPILDATIGLFRNHLNADEVTLETEIEEVLPDLDLNPTQIQQVFVNLIQNAAQAITSAQRPGTIRLTARRWMDGVAVEVSDDGPGMSPEVASRVFEPFFTTKPEGVGTGLGLSISQGIVKEHGGRITLTTAPGRGATFTVELPGRVAAARVAPQRPDPGVARPLSVLVVDDEPHILHYIRATLEAWGHTVVTAGDGETALEQAMTGRFDLIISDLRMPGTGGREFYEELRRLRPELAQRVAFSTGDTVRGDTLDFLERQGRPCLQKPFSLAELRALLRDAAHV